MSYNILLENLIGELGGCGLFQWMSSTIVHVGKAIATWSMLTMTFAGQDPGFSCSDGRTGNDSSFLNGSGIDTDQCKINGSESCNSFEFQDNMRTVVSEFDLVCDRKWIVAMITTIQMAGVLIGCFVAGNVADAIGRKPTFFLSLLIEIIFNIAGYFSTSWQMYAAMRFMIGIGVGFYLTVQYSLTLEFAASKWRPVIVSTPSFALEASLYAAVAWGFHDWKKIHLFIGLSAVPFLFTWFIMLESFRWLVTQRKFKEAERVVESVARVNRVPKPDISKILAMAEEDKLKANKTTKRYSALDLFRSKESIKTTLGLIFIWFAASYGYYGITFGVKSLSGDLYMNMFLINIVETPSTLLAAFLVNWFGRKKVCVGFYLLSGVAGITVGILQYIDSPISGQVTNILALVAKLGVASGWQAMIVFTNELYPTVVRTIAYGVHSTSARVGGMVAPQIVFLDDHIPGILYFLGGVLMMLSAGTILLFRETRGLELEDSLEEGPKKNKGASSTIVVGDNQVEENTRF